MSDIHPTDTVFDPEAVRAKYLAERDRRLVPHRADIRDLRTDEYFASYRDDPFTPYQDRDPVADEVDVVIVGGGIAGILAGARLREAGIGDIRIIDEAGGIGGTWYWNRYPGVMCDVESYIYLPMLEELDYIPKNRYAFGDEILHHLEAMADRFDLADDALFHTGVTGAEWQEGEARWRVRTDRGDEVSCRWYVLAVGILNLLKLPTIPGMEDFAGHSFHSARWDYAYTGGGPGQPLTNLSDKSVALFGTGASGIQIVPPLAAAAEHVYLFQRTPSAIGERGNRPTPPDFGKDFEPGWQKARMDNFQSIILGLPVDTDLVDDGWTHDYAGAKNAPRARRHDPRGVHAQRRRGRLQDHGGTPSAGGATGGRPGDGRGRQALLPLHVQAPVLPRRIPALPQLPERHGGRLPRRHRADHRAGPGRRRATVRGRLHRLRHRVRGRGHPHLPACRPRHRRPGRHHPGRRSGVPARPACSA